MLRTRAMLGDPVIGNTKWDEWDERRAQEGQRSAAGHRDAGRSGWHLVPARAISLREEHHQWQEPARPPRRRYEQVGTGEYENALAESAVEPVSEPVPRESV